jgi:glucose dehydrogenase
MTLKGLFVLSALSLTTATTVASLSAQEPGITSKDLLDGLSNPSRWLTYSGDYGAPLIVNGKVIVGVAGGEYANRGFIDAHNPMTGERIWRFYTIPAPGDPGSDTWTGDIWARGGGPTWLSGSYDPELNLLYWGTGNPNPDWDGDSRPGDNLYTGSLLALDPDTGKLKWHYGTHRTTHTTGMRTRFRCSLISRSTVVFARS